MIFRKLNSKKVVLTIDNSPERNDNEAGFFTFAAVKFIFEPNFPTMFKQFFQLAAFVLLPVFSGSAVAETALTTPIVSEEYGIASYYGDEFHGRKTANGERYDKNALSCAHKSLPFGTRVRITRLDNGKSIVLRVNDRGPYTKGYIVDLSRRAAELMGMMKVGIVKAKLEVLEDHEGDGDFPATASFPVEKPRPQKASVIEMERPELKPVAASLPTKIEGKKAKPVETEEKNQAVEMAFSKVNAASFKQYDLYKIEITRPQKAGFGVQVMTLKEADYIFQQVAKLQSSFDNVLLSVEPGKDEQPVYRIIVGPYADKKKAGSAAKTLAKKGFKGFVVELSEK